MAQSQKRIQQRWRLWLAFLISFLVPWACTLIVGEKSPQYDAWVYNQLASSFQQNGVFNFAAYAQLNGHAYRGFLLPWIIALCNTCSRWLPFLNYGFFISLFCAVISCYALPGLVEGIFGVRVPAWRRPIVSGLITLLFQGLLYYPLSDLWAAGFALLGVTAYLRMTTDAPCALWKRLLYALGCGACLGAAYNIRTIYLLLWFGLALAALVQAFRRREAGRAARLLWTPMIAVGLLVVSLPQMYSNAVTYQNPSPLLVDSEASTLFTYQLYNGIYEEKYESNVGVDYWEEGVHYVDDAGMLVLANEGMEATFDYNDGTARLTSIGDYVSLALRYPLDFIGIYARHFINMLDVRYPEIFVDQFEPSALYPAVNYVALYLSLAAFIAFVLRMEKQRMGRLWLLLILLLPTLAIAAGAVETRFGIMLQLVLWGCLTGLPDKQMLRQMRARDWVLLAAGLVVFAGVMAAVGGQTLASFEDYPVLY